MSNLNSLDTLLKKTTFINVEKHIESQYRINLLEDDLIDITYIANTQKAKGILFIESKANNLSKINWFDNKHWLFDAGSKFNSSSFKYPIFVRPCPIVPRHGFVDSVIVKNAEELNRVSKLTVEAETEAELLITTPIKANYNAIVCGDTITYGKGHDGATSGKNCQYFYLADSKYLDNLINLDNSLIQEGETPFYEIVMDNDKTYLVQVRSAPKIAGVKDYIPHTVEVKNIIKAEGDLLDWEAKIRTVDGKTTIVDHRTGSLSSHYAVHAVLNKVPVFTTYLPEIGSVVEPTVVEKEITEEDKNEFFGSFARGFSIANKVVQKSDKDVHQVARDVIMVALATLHNYYAVHINKDYRLLGMVLGLFTRTTFAISNGESRYCKDTTSFDKDNSGRTECYNLMYQRKVKDTLERIEKVYYAFRDLSWGGGFGGAKWADCTKNSINLYNACVGRDLKKITELFNGVINSMHNGGPYLNKVIDPSEFDRAAGMTSQFTLSNLKLIIDTLAKSWELSEAIDIQLSDFVEVKTDSKLISKAKQEIKNSPIKTPTSCVTEEKVPTNLETINYKVITDDDNENIIKNIVCTVEGKEITIDKSLMTKKGLEHLKYQIDGKLTSVNHWWQCCATNVVSKTTMNKLIKEAFSKKASTISITPTEIDPKVAQEVSLFIKSFTSIIETTKQNMTKEVKNDEVQIPF